MIKNLFNLLDYFIAQVEEMDIDEMREVKKTVIQELKESFVFKGETIENGLSQIDKITTIINKYI